MIWTTAKAYEIEHEARVRAEAVATALQSHNIALQTSLDWFRMRLTQLEHERAQLIYNYMGVKIAVPEIQQTPPASDIADNPLNALPNFSDMGDKEAARQGLRFAPDGTITDRDGNIVYDWKQHA